MFPIETHPWPPFLPDRAKVLIMGTFPPGEHRRSMEFYYPNPTNDFWRIMGLIFYGNSDALYDRDGRRFHLDTVSAFAAEKGIALNDTGYRVRRLRGNASDKYLEIVEPVDLDAVLRRIPDCRTIATTGEKAAGVIASLTATPIPAMGTAVPWGEYSIWRCPSTSRAYPLALDRKADYYRQLFVAAGIINP